FIVRVDLTNDLPNVTGKHLSGGVSLAASPTTEAACVATTLNYQIEGKKASDSDYHTMVGPFHQAGVWSNGSCSLMPTFQIPYGKDAYGIEYPTDFKISANPTQVLNGTTTYPRATIGWRAASY